MCVFDFIKGNYLFIAGPVGKRLVWIYFLLKVHLNSCQLCTNNLDLHLQRCNLMCRCSK